SDITFKFSKDQTGGNFGALEMTIPPGILGAPPHLHKGLDEVCRVLEGTIHIMVGEDVVAVEAGGWHLRPKGVVHTFWNSGSTPAKIIELCLPGGHEAYMNELSDLFINNARPQPGALNELAKKYDINFDWAKLPVVMETYKVRL
ncbi:MAG: cupin domain-containing protein, partial [Pedobacter sp.]